MALDYNALFADQGKLIKVYNLLGARVDGFETDFNAIANEYEDLDQERAMANLRGAYDGVKNSYVAVRAGLAASALLRMQSDSVVNEINSPSANIQEVIRHFIRQLREDGRRVNASSVSLGAVAADGTNSGSGTVLTTITLDGVNSPGRLGDVEYPPHLDYLNRTSELAPPSETVVVTCEQDASAGLREGGEAFRVTGTKQRSPHTTGIEGIGDGRLIRGAHAEQLFKNLDFETWNNNVPTSWTADVGVPGVHMFREAGAANVFHEDLSLKITGDGTQTPIQLLQAFDGKILQKNAAYFVTCQVRADSGILSGGALTIEPLKGENKTINNFSTGVIATLNAIPTTWTMLSGLVIIQDTADDKNWLSVALSGPALDSGKSIYIDDLSFSPVNYVSGFGVGVVRGSNPFSTGDRFTFTTTNTEGVIQQFMRRIFGVQLQSDTGGTENILDSLAT